MVDLRQHFDRVEVVNLTRRADRWWSFQDTVKKAGVCGFWRFPAVDGNFQEVPEWFGGGHAAWGCLLSHHRIISQALKDGCRNCLIFEDDVTFRLNFSEILPKVLEELEGRKWDMLYLGGMHLGDWRPKQVTEHLSQSNRIGRTHAYAINGHFFETILGHMMDPSKYGPNTHFDTALGKLQSRFQSTIMAVDPWICGQDEGFSDILGVRVKGSFWDDVRGRKSLEEKQRNLKMVVPL